MIGTTELLKYYVNICIKNKRQYNHYPQLGKRTNHDIWE